MMLQRDGSGSSLGFQLRLPFVPVATRQDAARVPTNGRGEGSFTYQLQLRLSSPLAQLIQPIIIDDLLNPEEGDASERAVL